MPTNSPSKIALWLILYNNLPINLAWGINSKQTQNSDIISMKIYFLFNFEIKILYPPLHINYPFLLMCVKYKTEFLSTYHSFSNLVRCVTALFCSLDFLAGHGWAPWLHSSKIIPNSWHLSIFSPLTWPFSSRLCLRRNCQSTSVTL